MTKAQRYKEALERHKKEVEITQSKKPEPPSFHIFRAPLFGGGKDKRPVLCATVTQDGSLELHQQNWLNEAEAADFAKWITKWFSPDTCSTSKREQASGPDDHDVDGKGGGGPDEAPATSTVGIVALPSESTSYAEGEQLGEIHCMTADCGKGFGHDGVCGDPGGAIDF